jgi:hypothetical protein
MSVIFKLHQFENTWLMALTAGWWESWTWQVHHSWHKRGDGCSFSRNETNSLNESPLTLFPHLLNGANHMCPTRKKWDRDWVNHCQKQSTMMIRNASCTATHGLVLGLWFTGHILLEASSTFSSNLGSQSTDSWNSQCQDVGMLGMFWNPEARHRSRSLGRSLWESGILLCAWYIENGTLINICSFLIQHTLCP